MFLPHSDREVGEILQRLGLSSLEDLFSHIDPSLLEPPKNLPEPKSRAIRRMPHFGSATAQQHMHQSEPRESAFDSSHRKENEGGNGSACRKVAV